VPELPEVEVTRQYITPHILGKSIQTFEIYPPRLRYPLTEPALGQVAGQKLVSVGRRGKYLVLELSRGSLIVHLGMSGNLRVLFQNENRGKHDRAEWVFSDGLILRYSDPRRFGFVIWVESWQAYLGKIKRDALADSLDGQYLKNMAQKHRKKRAKSFIMDQTVIAGVGNIYANEALFRARISPLRRASQVSLARYNRLASAIQEVLQEAVQKGGTTLKDGGFAGNDQKSGWFQLNLRVYGRAHEPCLNCRTLLKDARLEGRATVYCPQCQK